jgi:putative endonuclease
VVALYDLWIASGKRPRNDKKRIKTMKNPAVYIMANERNGTIYTGVSSNLVQRVFQHKNEINKGFTANYSCKTLVYYEICETMETAIIREKQLKGGSRKNKLTLIEKNNPTWRDLYPEIV